MRGGVWAGCVEGCGRGGQRGVGGVGGGVWAGCAEGCGRRGVGGVWAGWADGCGRDATHNPNEHNTFWTSRAGAMFTHVKRAPKTE